MSTRLIAAEPRSPWSLSNEDAPAVAGALAYAQALKGGDPDRVRAFVLGSAVMRRFLPPLTSSQVEIDIDHVLLDAGAALAAWRACRAPEFSKPSKVWLRPDLLPGALIVGVILTMLTSTLTTCSQNSALQTSANNQIEAQRDSAQLQIEAHRQEVALDTRRQSFERRIDALVGTLQRARELDWALERDEGRAADGGARGIGSLTAQVHQREATTVAGILRVSMLGIEFAPESTARRAELATWFEIAALEQCLASVAAPDSLASGRVVAIKAQILEMEQKGQISSPLSQYLIGSARADGQCGEEFDPFVIEALIAQLYLVFGRELGEPEHLSGATVDPSLAPTAAQGAQQAP